MWLIVKSGQKKYICNNRERFKNIIDRGKDMEIPISIENRVNEYEKKLEKYLSHLAPLDKPLWGKEVARPFFKKSPAV